MSEFVTLLWLFLFAVASDERFLGCLLVIFIVAALAFLFGNAIGKVL